VGIAQPTSLHTLFGQPSQAENDQSDPPPYSGQNPLFISSPGQFIYAFWTNPEDALYVSRVARNNFMSVDSWSEAHLLAASVASFFVDVDTGELHGSLTHVC
jgi:hypothetical protein